jgi:outer membrane protein assembly factor BamA
VASRLATAVSLGPDPEYFSLGGTETIPGLKLHELTGENHVLANLEIRFPLVDYLGFGTGWSVRQLRGSLFAAAGSAFDDFEALDLWDRRPLRLKDLKASIGAQASVRLSRMYLRLTAAWPTDLESIADSPVLTFTIASLPSF